MLARIDANKSELNFTMSSELTSLSERLSCLWTTTQDKILGKQAMLSYHRYVLRFETKNKNINKFSIMHPPRWRTCDKSSSQSSSIKLENESAFEMSAN